MNELTKIEMNLKSEYICNYIENIDFIIEIEPVFIANNTLYINS